LQFHLAQHASRPVRVVPPIGRRVELRCMAFWRIAGGQIPES
jgi:hypothetical protein